MSGIIIEVGTRVTKFKVGDRVAVPFILSCGECCMCTHHKRPTICEQQEQPVSDLETAYALCIFILAFTRMLSIIPGFYYDGIIR